MAILTDEIINNLARYKQDPWAFLSECVYTLDQVDQDNPIKPFPAHRDYLRLFVRLWQRYPWVAIPKSRRMTMSWTCIALYLWDTIFKKGRSQAFVSKKEENAGELVERAEFIFKNIPEHRLPRGVLPKIEGGSMKKKPPRLLFPELHSKIEGYPMGADQLRQFTFSGIMGDESAFWPDAEEFFSASKPTTDGGGRMTLISSVGPGFFKRLVFDTLSDGRDSETIPENANLSKPMQGIRVWQNPDNQFLVCEIHYTADPNKRSSEFVRTVKAGLPLRKFLQEYELNWDTFEGLPVYADFSERHTTNDNLEPKLGLPLLCGWDFGLTPACIVAQLQGQQLVILREFVSQNEAINTFAPKVMGEIRTLYPEWVDAQKDFRHYIDPAGFNRAETDARTCAQVMEESAGIRNVFPGAPASNAFEPRRGAVESRLIKHTKDGPGIILNEKTSPTLVKGFRGGYQYPESYGQIEPTSLRPLKNKYSHPHDALQYLCWGTGDLINSYDLQIPTPSYTFIKGYEEEVTGASKYGYKKT